MDLDFNQDEEEYYLEDAELEEAVDLLRKHSSHHEAYEQPEDFMSMSREKLRQLNDEVNLAIMQSL